MERTTDFITLTSATRRIYEQTPAGVGDMATAYKARKEQRIINN